MVENWKGNYPTKYIENSGCRSLTFLSSKDAAFKNIAGFS